MPSSLMKAASTGLPLSGACATPRSAASATSSAPATTGGTNSTITASMPGSASTWEARPRTSRATAEPSMSTGLRGSPRAAGARRARARVSAESGGSSSPASAQASAQRIPSPPAFVSTATRRPSGQRLRREQDGGVGELLERVGLDHPRLAEERVDGRGRAGQRGGMRPRRALPRAAVRPPFIARIGFFARDAPREPRELARVPERLEVEQDQVGLRVVLPVLEQVVRRDVRLVADRDERREPEPAGGAALEDGEPERTALRREADVARREGSAGRRSRSDRAPAEKMPRQFGPISRAPCARTRASSCSWRRTPVGARLGEPGRDHAERARPLRHRRLRLVQHGLGREAEDREVDGRRGCRRSRGRPGRLRRRSPSG